MEACDWLWLFVKCSLSIVKITRLIFIRETSLCHTTPTFLARYNLFFFFKKKKKKDIGVLLALYPKFVSNN